MTTPGDTSMATLAEVERAMKGGAAARFTIGRIAGICHTTSMVAPCRRKGEAAHVARRRSGGNDTGAMRIVHSRVPDRACRRGKRTAATLRRPHPGSADDLLWPLRRAWRPGTGGSRQARDHRLHAAEYRRADDGGHHRAGRQLRALSMNLEGRAPANYLNSLGIAAFVLRYRLGPAYHHPIELGDAQRAIRTGAVACARSGIIAPDRIGIMGFSAGGHLASSVVHAFRRRQAPTLPIRSIASAAVRTSRCSATR